MPPSASPGASAAGEGDALLTSHAAGLRRLALSIVRDADTADDVVQDAYARSLAVPAPSGSGWIGWMRVVVRGLARNRLRDERARARREAAYSRERAAAAAEHDDERAETLRAVVDSVLELDEPYRRVVLATYFEGLDPAAIAAREGIAVATVGTRLKRARAQLRGVLEKRLARHRGGALGALAFVAGIARDPASASSPLLTALRAHPQRAALVAALLTVFVGVAWILLELRAPERVGGEIARVVEEDAPRAQPPPGSFAEAASESSRPPPPVAAEPQTSPAAASLPAPAPAIDGLLGEPLVPTGPGPFEFTLVVRALDRAGHPQPGARVVGAPRHVPLHELGVTDWRGELELSWRAFEPNGTWVVGVRHDEEGRSALCETELTSSTPVRVVLACSPAPRARDDKNDAIDEADLAEFLGESPRRGSRDVRRRGKSSAPSRVAPTDLPALQLDAHGNAELVDPLLLAPLGESEASPLPGRSPEMGARARVASFRLGEQQRPDLPPEWAGLVEEPEARLRAWIGNRPKVRVRCRIEDTSGQPALSVPVSFSFRSLALRVVTSTDRDGRLDLELPQAEEVLVVWGDAARGLRSQPLRFEDAELDLQLTLPKLRNSAIVLRDSLGRPARGWTIELYDAENPCELIAQTATDADGRASFTLEHLGPFRVLARRAPAAIDAALLVHESAVFGATEQAFALPQIDGTGRLEARLASASGERPHAVDALLWEPHTRQALQLSTPPAGPSVAERWRTVRSPVMHAGLYVFEAGASGQRRASFGEVHVVGGKGLDLGVVPFRESALLALEDATGRALDVRTSSAPPPTLDVQLELRTLREGVIVKGARKLVAPVRIEVAPCRAELTLSYRAPAARDPAPSERGAGERGAPERGAGERESAVRDAPARTPPIEPRLDRYELELAPGRPVTLPLGAPRAR